MSGKPRTDFDPMVRGVLLGMRLAEGKTVDSLWVQRQFTTSRATANRDIARIATALPAIVESSTGDRGAVSLSLVSHRRLAP